MKQLILCVCIVFLFSNIKSQSVGIGTTNPNSASVLDLGPSGKPLILPRLDSIQMTAVSPATKGMFIFNTKANALHYTNGSKWIGLVPGIGTLPAATTGQTLRYNGTVWVADSIIWSDGTQVNINLPNTTSSYKLNVNGLPDYDGMTVTGQSYGVDGEASVYGVIGTSTSTAGGGAGVRGNSTEGDGVYGYSENQTGVTGYSNNPNPGNGVGVDGGSANGDGVHGSGGPSNIGVYGTAGAYGVYGQSTGGTGVYGTSTSGTAIKAVSSTSFAGYFDGPLTYIKKLGVGTISPAAPLHVAGYEVLNSGLSYYYGAGITGAAIASNNPGSWAIGLLVDYDIVGQRSVVSAQNVISSDSRIKNIIGPSDNNKDLKILRKIAVTNYTFKDFYKMGNGVQKKVIAQQIETIYPQAVQQRRGFIPDIYSMAVVTNTKNAAVLKTEKPHGLKAGDTIKLIDTRDGETEVQVMQIIDEYNFSIEPGKLESKNKIFVYGKSVDDFRVVDYEALSVLNISATQELLRRMEADENSWKKENKLLKKRLSKIEAALKL